MFRVLHGVIGVALVAVAACGDAARADTATAPPAAAAVQAPAAAPAAAPARAATAFDGAQAWQHLERIVAIGPRPSGSPELRQTRAYITRALATFGVTVQEQRFTATTPRGPIEMVNLIARLPGRRTDRILLTGHYDTKRMANVRFVGASDGEEATCSGWTECGTTASPDNTYGSRYYVAAAREANAIPSLRAMILVDLIGDRDLELRRDSNSTPWLVDILWSTARRLAYNHIFVDTSTSVEDDHFPFLAAKIPSVDLIDLDTFPYWHTPDDTLDKLSPRSLQAVGDVVIAALPEIEARLSK
jgi:glutaminyl-peptide cyclotransferase